MIPPAFRLYAALATLCLIGALLAALFITRATLARVKAAHAAELSAIRERTAEVYADAAGKALAKERSQSAQARKSADEHAQANAALSARYDRLWKQHAAAGTQRPASVPSPSEAAAGASTRACGDGLWCIPRSLAVSLMYEADKNTKQLVDLIASVRAQEEIAR